MNTNALKRFAKEARIKLLDQVGRKLHYVTTNSDSVFVDQHKTQIKNLKDKVNAQGEARVIEYVAYTWFNRLMALRFMDANNYNVPKVVTPVMGKTPEILQNVLGGHIDPALPVDRNRLNELLDHGSRTGDAQTEAYKLLLIASCNQWHAAMPFMFERIADFTELLLPDDLLSDHSIVAEIRDGMSDEDCQEEEILGWLYQFYISDKKDEVFDGLKKNIKITAENIPAATQLFTPHWIVRYMVENTLGKLWLTLKPQSKLREHMPYFIESPEGNPPAPLPEGVKGVTDITFLDPCQGSGHVLVYAFDLFARIYEEEGYNTHEIPSLIFQHNLFGIDIDQRAAQLAAFALTMKARNYHSRFLRKPIQPHVIALENVSEEIIKQAVKIPLAVGGKFVYDHRDLTIYLLTQAENFGSLIQIDPEELKALQIQKGSLWQEQELKISEQAEFLSRKYHCVVTNPPYMGIKGMNSILKQFVEQNYPNSKADLMSCFIECCLAFNYPNGKTSMINQHSWMFLSSYNELRPYLIHNVQLESLLHLGAHTFPEIGGEVVQNVAFSIGNFRQSENGVYIRLTEYKNAQEKDKKTIEALRNSSCKWLFTFNQKNFEKIPGSPLGYWLSKRMIEIFSSYQRLSNFLSPRQGTSTGDNIKFLRLWHEVENRNTFFNCQSINSCLKSSLKWYPATKGGTYRRWFGNNDYVVNWRNNGKEISNFSGSAIRNKELNFTEALTWTGISSTNLGVRYCPSGFVFTISGKPISGSNSDILFYFLGLLCSNVAVNLLKVIAPTLSFEVGYICNIPAFFHKNKAIEIIEIVSQCIKISQEDWNSKEISWDFQNNELIKRQNKSLKSSLELYTNYWIEKFYFLHNSEVELNRQFIEIYGLQDELAPNIPMEETTILQEEVNILNGEAFIDQIPVFLQLLSYSIGCFFGRYSLDKPGLILANQGETLQDFLHQVPTPTFTPDEDNIIPVLEGEWFTDDIVGRFRSFIKVAFGEEHYEENLKYIEDTMGKDIRKYFVKDFYNDHIKRYKKRPIYWMFSSPKGHFKALIYMHRYQPDLCSRMLQNYVQEFIGRLTEAKNTQTRFSLREDISAREKTLAQKEVDKLTIMLKDCSDYAEILHKVAIKRIAIDLDDGVKVNYMKFKEVLVPIKGLEKEEE